MLKFQGRADPPVPQAWEKSISLLEIQSAFEKKPDGITADVVREKTSYLNWRAPSNELCDIK